MEKKLDNEMDTRTMLRFKRFTDWLLVLNWSEFRSGVVFKVS